MVVSRSSSQRGMRLSIGGPICAPFIPVISAEATLPWAISRSKRVNQAAADGPPTSSGGSKMAAL